MPHALEIARFRAKPDAEDDLLAERPAMIDALRRNFPGVRDAYLAQTDDGTWVDVVVWESREQAETAQRQVFDRPEVVGWFRHIEEVVSMEHATLRGGDL